MRFGLAFAIGIGVLFVSPAAHASPIYPPIVAEVTGAAHSPQCIICHETPQGGIGTATRGFAVYLRSRGLVAKDEASLRAALAAAKGEMHDTDGDGVPDVDELSAGRNPNGDAAVASPIEYGCVSMTGEAPGPFWIFSAIFLAVRICRKKRARF